ENKLKQFRDIEPDEKFWHITKSVLLNKIEKDMTSHKHQRFSFDSLFFDFSAFAKTFIPGMKFASVLMSVLVVISGTFIGAKASMPGTAIGNILYPVKTQLIEPAELALAKNDIDKTNILLNHASNRLEEINYLIDKRREDQISKVTDNMQNSLSLANDSLKTVKSQPNTNKDKLVELAKSINENSGKTIESLKIAQVNSKNVDNLIKSAKQLNTTALEIIVKENTDQEIVNKSLNNQIILQLESIKQIDEKLSTAKQTLSKTHEITTSTNSTLSSDIKPIQLNKQEIEFSIDSIEKVVDTKQINELIESAKKLLDEGQIDEAYITIKKVEFYINLADKTLDAQDYELRLQELEKAINQAQVKSETELKVQ
ncbi:MAG TPA: DUF5667 domain-containing protein, partial [bacterium]|nr:DUF5667 domain-containing protein [bacterium]